MKTHYLTLMRLTFNTFMCTVQHLGLISLSEIKTAQKILWNYLDRTICLRVKMDIDASFQTVRDCTTDIDENE